MVLKIAQHEEGQGNIVVTVGRERGVEPEKGSIHSCDEVVPADKGLQKHVGGWRNGELESDVVAGYALVRQVLPQEADTS